MMIDAVFRLRMMSGLSLIKGLYHNRRPAALFSFFLADFRFPCFADRVSGVMIPVSCGKTEGVNGQDAALF